MDRRRYPQQQYVPPGMVDFGQIDFGHDVVAQQMPGILQNYQQRWDMQDAAIAKLLEEQAGTQMLEGDAQAVGNLLKGSFDEIDTLVKDKYQGDRGAAAMDIVKRLSAARAPLAQAKAEKERYDKAFAEYQNAAQRGQAPRGNYDPTTGTFQTLGFEDFYKDTQRSAFDEKGKYIPREYQPLRGAGQHSEYIAKNYSKALQDRIISKVPQLANIEDIGNMIKSGQLRGITDEEVNKLFFRNGELTDEGRAYVQDFKANSTFAEQEFGEAFKDDKVIGEFIANTVKAQTVGSIVDSYSQYTPKEGGGGDDDGLFGRSVVYEGGLVANPEPFTAKTFRQNNPNARAYISRQWDEPLKESTGSLQTYLSGETTLAELQAITVENNIRKSVPVLQELWEKGKKTNEDIAKEIGYDSLEDFNKARAEYYSTAQVAERNKSSKVSTSGLQAISAASASSHIKGKTKGDIIFDRYDRKVKERNAAASDYSKRLKDNAEEYIEKYGMDADYGVTFFQPDFTQEKTSTAYNQWNMNIKEGFTNPGQFTFLDGDLAKKSATTDKKNEAYKKKGSEFTVMGVGGNSEVGLVWKVRNPDGTVSNATWDTGYEKQLGYLQNVLRNPELIETLNASTFKIAEGGEIKVSMPDAPPELSRNIGKYNISTEPLPSDPRLNLVKSKNGYIVLKENAQGQLILGTTNNRQEATPLDKSLIFLTITSLQ